MNKQIKGGTHQSIEHESAHKHVSGRAEYLDDVIEPAGTLHAYLGLSTCANGKIKSMDLDAVRKAPGIVDVLTKDDIPGENDVSPTGLHDEPIFARGEVHFYGQPLFAVVAKTRDQARAAQSSSRLSGKCHARSAPSGYTLDGPTWSWCTSGRAARHAPRWQTL